MTCHANFIFDKFSKLNNETNNQRDIFFAKRTYNKKHNNFITK